LYFGIGAAFGLAPFLEYWLVPIMVVIAVWQGLAVAFWWLRRKLAFQQAALPYLFRLANFASNLEPALVKAVTELANVKDRRTNFFAVLVGNDPLPRTTPETRHLLICGPLGAGKTSLCVGIGTEFAFALGKGRYLSATKLVESVIADIAPGDREYEDGLVLWNWHESDLLIVDDVDAGVRAPAGLPQERSLHLIEPSDLIDALSDDKGNSLMTWLGTKRSVWVVGDTVGDETTDPAAGPNWRVAIAQLLGLQPQEIGVVELCGSIGLPPPPVAPSPHPRPSGKLVR
jgi:hypothetical protein